MSEKELSTTRLAVIILFILVCPSSVLFILVYHNPTPTPPTAVHAWFDPHYWDMHRRDNQLPDVWLDGHHIFTTRDLMGRNI